MEISPLRLMLNKTDKYLFIAVDMILKYVAMT